MTLEEVRRILQPREIVIGRTFTSSGGHATAYLDDRYCLQFGIDHQARYAFAFGSIERASH